uniref:IclR-family transcriptional regulator n=1 Tax=Pseudomonas fluorescens TaxID=294 RepID=A0A220ITC3_PSEFL|nr:IclR family transcriptional regulator [Pseudomonas fluorescens]ASI38108.1 Putative IclR-family transcriptional regulator [Pseudomonas fluorescens]AWH58705.1 Putative IclR-family transcriptional regulator [Pseudomonas fluorescens]
MNNVHQQDNDDIRSSGIQVIARASAVMQALGRNPKGLSLADIAKEVGLARSTVQRIIAALETEQMVEAIRPGKGFRLGPALAQLIQQTHTDIVSIAHKTLEELCEQLKETVTLSCISGRKSVVIDRIIAEQELRVVFPMGLSLPMHATADGKALLSTLSNEQVREWLGDAPAQLTDATHNLDSLLVELDKIRITGFAVDHQEHTVGISSCSILIPTFMGPHAVSVVAPTSRFQTHFLEFKQALGNCKTSISKMAGGN